MFTIGYAIYLFGVATFLALLEIQIEGQNGWAKNLPCWRPKDKDSFAVKVYMLFMSGRELTGYHIVMFFFVFLILHFPFFAGVGWTGKKELWVVSNYFLLSVTWDFLWHVWNPSYGIRKFSPKTISPDYKWLGPVPLDYINGILVSSVSAWIAGVDLSLWFTAFFIFWVLTLASCFLSLMLIKK